MGRPKNYKKAELLSAIAGSGGIVNEVARRLKCDWNTARLYVNKYEETKAAFAGEEEVMLDRVEKSAYALALDGDARLIRFILSTKGKKRGWTEERDEGEGEKDLQLQICFAPQEEDAQ